MVAEKEDSSFGAIHVVMGIMISDERRTSPRTRERLSIAKPLGSRPSVDVMVI
jgi:hypothetical protein